MKRLAVVTAVTAMVLPLLAAVSGQAATAEAAAETDQPVGPGQYFADSRTFELSELDAAAAVIGRKHAVAAVDGGLAQPKAVPASRADLSVFGPGWQAEFLGGTTGRKLEISSDAAQVTELGTGEQTRYAYKSGAAFPDGGEVRRYEAADGSKLTETSRWDAAAGTLRTTVSETISTNLGTTEAGDDGFTDDAGNAISSADLNQTYVWQQAGASQSDAWRVTGVGTNAFGTSTVQYDAQGRVATITEPAAGEELQNVLSFTYATATTATGTAFGDYAGRLKQITQTSGTGTPQSVAAYSYDSAGLLRTMADPSQSGTQPATYAYDTAGRLTSFDSRLNGGWQLTYTGDSALPTATAAAGNTTPGASDSPPPSLDPPAPGATTGGGEVAGPLSYPSNCWAAVHWMYYSRPCAAWAAHYGWHYPYWRQLPTKRWVVGILYDHCTKSPDKPSGFNFTSACDMHDYGYGIIGNNLKRWYYPYYLDWSRKSDVDSLFYTTLRDWTCTAYSKIRRPLCRNIAWTYRQFVRKGNPKNGANATRD
ncbi:phospholipase A2 [Nonomuraea wenchangensis]|uniref:YD repeat-containing protein n=1 Tax=Nonomuraea wenchangensis TaxID=568860 RepID=A0A1I0LK00_9ACTN|nr:phospholipase A2 [Nonomuraea wenchangensis]SEU40629.1 YD repeat-containing protein [Nonomuraea wenchangensis]